MRWARESRGFILFVGLPGMFLRSVPFLFAEPIVPPTQVFTVDLGAAAERDLLESRQSLGQQSDTTASFSFIGRWSLSGGPFYFSAGVRGESFNFDPVPTFPIRQLQDYGARLSIEYYVGSVKAASVTIDPGFYFETHPTLASWDVPVEAVTGLPINPSLNGVAGVAYGRFWHHPLPIVGLSWTLSPQWRLDALYPDPALTYTINKTMEAQLTGQLLGNGFRTDAEPDRSIVEYHVYRAGGNFVWVMLPGIKFTSGAGLEYERVFDYWRAVRSFRATGSPYLKLGIEWAR